MLCPGTTVPPDHYASGPLCTRNTMLTLCPRNSMPPEHYAPETLGARNTMPPRHPNWRCITTRQTHAKGNGQQSSAVLGTHNLRPGQRVTKAMLGCLLHFRSDPNSFSLKVRPQRPRKSFHLRCCHARHPGRTIGREEAHWLGSARSALHLKLPKQTCSFWLSK